MSKGFQGNPLIRKAGDPVEYSEENIGELLRCSQDPAYFVENYIKIKNVDYEELVLFKMRWYQKLMLETCIKHRKVITKLPRQAGKTSISAALLLWHILFIKNYSALVVAHKLDKARDIVGAIKEMIENLPTWLQQGVVEWNKGNIVLENKSRVRASATSASSARGDTYNCVTGDSKVTVRDTTTGDIETLTISKLHDLLTINSSKKIDRPHNLNYPLHHGLVYQEQLQPPILLSDREGEEASNHRTFRVRETSRSTEVTWRVQGEELSSPDVERTFVSSSIPSEDDHWQVEEQDGLGLAIHDHKAKVSTPKVYDSKGSGEDRPRASNHNWQPKPGSKVYSRTKASALGGSNWSHSIGQNQTEDEFGAEGKAPNSKAQRQHCESTHRHNKTLGRGQNKQESRKDSQDGRETPWNETQRRITGEDESSGQRTTRTQQGEASQLTSTVENEYCGQNTSQYTRRPDENEECQGYEQGSYSPRPQEMQLSFQSKMEQTYFSKLPEETELGSESQLGNQKQNFVSRDTAKYEYSPAKETRKAEAYLYEILTERGFRPFDKIKKTYSQKTIKLVLEDGTTLACTPDHKIATDAGWIEAHGLKEHDHVITLVGPSKIQSITPAETTDVYDPINVHETHSFFANDILCRNCVLLDEFAFVPTHLADEFIRSVIPTVSAGKTTKIWITSTPKGLNMFYKMWCDAQMRRSDYVPIEIKWNDVPGRDEDWRQKVISEFGEQYFEQEYGAEFLGSSRTLIAASCLRRLTWIEPIEVTDHFRIFDKAVKGHHYVITVDTSEGIGTDYSVAVVFDVSRTPYQVACIYRNRYISEMAYPNVLYNLGKSYNNAMVLIEINKSPQIADILHYDMEYESVIWIKRKRSSQYASDGFDSSSRPGLYMDMKIKRYGCLNLKSLIENDQLIINDYLILAELERFVLEGGRYQAEEGNDDLVMSLVQFAWLVDNGYIREITETSARARVAEAHQAAIDSEMMPLGFVTYGDEEIKLEGYLPAVRADDNRWLFPELKDEAAQKAKRPQAYKESWLISTTSPAEELRRFYGSTTYDD